MSTELQLGISAIIFISIGIITFRQNKKKKTIKERNFLPSFIFSTLGIVFLFVSIFGETREEINERENQTTEQSEETQTLINSTCTICGNKFEGNGYEEVSSGVWELLQDPYSGTICSVRCGMKHTEKMNDIANSYGVDLGESQSNNQNTNEYEMGNDGKVYETNACTMCKGTGVTKGRNYLSGEIEYLTCQMCEGQGVRSY